MGPLGIEQPQSRKSQGAPPGTCDVLAEAPENREDQARTP